jgi:hypothetical protein
LGYTNHTLNFNSLELVFVLHTTDGVPFALTLHTGMLVDDATGDRATNDIYDDVNPAQLEALPSTAWHRNVDSLLVDADKEGKFFTL